MKNTMSEMKNILHGTAVRLNTEEESDQMITELQDCMKRPISCIIRVPGEREKERDKEKKIFEEIMAKPF